MVTSFTAAGFEALNVLSKPHAWQRIGARFLRNAAVPVSARPAEQMAMCCANTNSGVHKHDYLDSPEKQLNMLTCLFEMCPK